MQYFENVEVNKAFVSWFSMAHLSKDHKPANHPNDNKRFYEFLILLFKNQPDKKDIEEELKRIAKDERVDFDNNPDSIGEYIIRYEDIRGFYENLLEKGL
jgi:hypothetical protein